MLKKKADILYQNHKNTSLLLTNLHQTESSLLSKEDLDITLKYLQKNKKISLFEISGQTGIKFSSEPITIVDTGVLQMKYTLSSLELQQVELEKEIESSTQKAISLSKQKKQANALVYLKRRKRLNVILLQRLNSSETLHQILENIEEAHTNKEILEAYQIGTAALKETNKQGLTLESVEQTLDDLHEVMANQKEIDEALSSGVEVIDDSEVEEELKSLMESESMLQNLKLETSLNSEKELRKPPQKEPRKLESSPLISSQKEPRKLELLHA